MLKTNGKIFVVLSITIIILLVGSFAFFGCKQESAGEETATGEEEIKAEEASQEEPAEETTEALQFEGQELIVSGSTTLLPFAEPAAAAFMEKFGGSITVSGGGSGVGISECINGLNDIGNASRQVKDAEKEDAAAIGIELVEVLVAYDGIAIIVSGNVGIEDLTIEQLSGIFRGETINWEDVGGEDAEIILASRDSNSGTFEYFLERVVQLDKTQEDYDFSPTVLALQSNADVVNTVTSTDNAIGYVGLGYMEEALSKGANSVKVEGIVATVESVKDGSYPISRGLYDYYRKDDLSEIGQAYLDFVLSEEGQAIVLETGFVPLS